MSLPQSPAIVGGANPQIHGIGAGLLYSLAELAGLLDVPLVWGEATAFSAPFYEHTLNLAGITDHFFVQGPTLNRCRRLFLEKAHGVA